MSSTHFRFGTKVGAFLHWIRVVAVSIAHVRMDCPPVRLCAGEQGQKVSGAFGTGHGFVYASV